MDSLENIQYQDELNANKFCTVFLSIMCGACLLIWVANEMGIFIVNKLSMRVGMIIACSSLVAPLIVFTKTGGNRPYFKYMILYSVTVMAFSIQTFLTFHGVMMCIFPLLITIQYSDRRMFKLAAGLSLAGIPFSTLLGYYLGCWDGNMIYSNFLDQNTDSLAARAEVMTAGYLLQLFLFFMLPRMVIFCIICYCTNYILKTRRLQYERIQSEAELDGLTKLENRAKYNQRVASEYKNLNSVYVAFIDLNYLKKINDECGHEAGDSALRRTADEIRKLVNKTVHGYRLGGDEFAVVFCNYSQDISYRILHDWEKTIKPLNRKEEPVQCSLAIGTAFATKPFDIDKVLKEADENMYIRKTEMKAHRTD